MSYIRSVRILTSNQEGKDMEKFMTLLYALGLFLALYVLACLAGAAFSGCNVGLTDHTCVDHVCEPGGIA